MGKLVLTKNSDMKCSHFVAPSGNVGNQGLSSKLEVGGAEALLAGDLAAASISSCPVVESGSTKKCLATAIRSGGDASKLFVGALPVLLADTNGATDSSPPGTYSVVDPKQSKLEAT